MAKITKSVRMSEDTIKKLAELVELLKETEADIFERSVAYLYENRAAVYEQDVAERRKKLK